MSAQKAPLGGMNYIELFSYSGSTLTSLLVLDKIESHDWSGHPKKLDLTLNVVLKQGNKAFWDAIDDYVHSYATEDVRQNFEDGTYNVTNSAVTSAPKLVAIVYGFEDATVSPHKIFTRAIQCYLSGDTGNYKTGYQALLDTSFQLKAMPFDTAFNFVSSYETSIVDAPVSATAVVGEYSVDKWLDKA